MRNLFLLLSFFCCTIFADTDFEVEMGKGTAYWNEVKTTTDLALLDFYKEHFKNQIEGEGIPQIFHFILIGSKISSSYYQNIRHWLNSHPNWKAKFWTDNKDNHIKLNNLQICEISSLQENGWKYFLNMTENDVEKEELLKFAILEAEGGVFIDLDVKCLKNIEDLQKKSNFFCVLAPPHDSILGTSITPSFAIIAAKDNHPIIKETLQKMKHSWKRSIHYFPLENEESFLYRATYRIERSFQEALQEKISQNDWVLPASYLYPINDKLPLYAKHDLKCSWVRGKCVQEEGSILDIYQLKKKIQIAFFLTLLLSSGLLIGSFFFRRKA